MESPSQKPAKTSENTKQDVPLFFSLAVMTLGCARILSSWEYGISLNKFFALGGGGFFNRSKGKHKLKGAESHRCEVNI